MFHRQIPNYLPHAILTAIFCCMPLGLIGLYYSFQVNRRLRNEDFEGAWAASRRARMWCTVSFVIGFLCLFIYALGQAFTLMGGK
ncbi:MAG: CD225/dispanin family protein [Chthoniobacteraceae bacterium]